MSVQKLNDPLAACGVKASRIGFGMWRMVGDDVDATLATIDAAREAGISLFDTADIYGLGTASGFGGAERLFGRVLRARPALRGEIVLATKGGITPPVPYNSSAAYLVEACEASLSRLGVEVIDLYQIHRPDHLAHPAEVADAFSRLYRDGKIRAVGVSNYTVAQTRALIAHLDLPLAATQPEYSPLCLQPLEDGTLDLAMEQNIAVLAWSPLGGGRLMSTAGSERERAVMAALDQVAGAHAVSRAVAAAAWVMAHPSRPIALLGSQSPDRLRVLAAATEVRLTREEWYAVLVASRGVPMP